MINQSVFRLLLRRRPARLQHLLHDVELDPGLGLVLCDGEVVEHVVVALVGGQRVPVLVGGPVELGGVGVAGADVLGLKVLQLAVDVVALAHLADLVDDVPDVVKLCFVFILFLC